MIFSKSNADEGADNSGTLQRVIWAMTVILSISLATNLWLAVKNKRLSESAAAATAPRPRLQVGATVSPFSGTDVDGRRQSVSYEQNDLPVVLYIFTPECIWCARNLDNLKRLVSQKHEAYRFVGLSLSNEKLKDYVAENKFEFPIYSALPENVIREYKLGPTPQTIVISPQGRVLQNWTGAYVDSQQAEVERFFGIQLPGLTSKNK